MSVTHVCPWCMVKRVVHRQGVGVLQRKESYLHVQGGRVTNGEDSSSMAATPPPPAPHSVRNGPDYVNDPNSLQSYNWYVSVVS